MKVMILAAGLGKRLLPLTDKIPKPLVKVQSKALIIWHIENLVNAGFREIVINVSHLKEQIINTLGNGSDFGCRIEYSIEEKPLETLGGILNAFKLLSNFFVVINADIYTDFDFSILKNTNLSKENNLAELVLVKGHNHDFAINPLDSKKCINIYKITNNQKTYTFSGIALYSKEFFSPLTKQNNNKIKEYKKLAPYLFERVDENIVKARVHHGLWSDVGTIKRLWYLNKLLKEKD